MANPVVELQEKLSVKSENESELYHVTFSAANPNQAAAVVNAVMSEYLNLHESQARDRGRKADTATASRSGPTQNGTDEQAGQCAKTRPLRDWYLRGFRDNARAAVAARRPTNGPLNLPARRSNWPCRKPLSWHSSSRTGITRRGVPEVVLDEAVAADPGVQNLQSELKQAKETLAGARVGSLLANRSAEQVDFLQQRLEQKLSVLTDELRVKMERRDSAVRRADEEDRIGELESQITASEGISKFLNTKLDEYYQALRSSGENAVELDFARRDLSRAEDVHEKLCERIDQLRTETRAPARITVLKPASPPRSPVELYPVKLVGLVGMATFALPLLFAGAWEYRSQRIDDVEHLPSHDSLPILGEITSLPRYPRFPKLHASESYYSQRAAFENSIHYLCRSLLLSATSSQSRVFAITSAD